jgi:hypothetical protein
MLYLLTHKPLLVFSLFFNNFRKNFIFFGAHLQCSCRKLTTRLVMPARLHVCIDRRRSHWTDLCKILYSGILLKFVATSRFLLHRKKYQTLYIKTYIHLSPLFITETDCILLEVQTEAEETVDHQSIYCLSRGK